MNLRHRATAITTVILLATMVFSSVALAGKVYQLEFQYCVPYAGGPTDVTANYYEKEVDPGDLQGSTTAAFDGVTNTNVSCDDPLVCITDISMQGGELCATFLVTGQDNSKFKSSSAFEVVVGGESYSLELHTSCSKDIPLNTPLTEADEAVDNIVGNGSLMVIGGNGECISVEGCPPADDKLFELDGEIRIPAAVLAGCMVTDITFNVFKKEDDLRGTATAMFTGAGLTGITNDSVAELLDATMDGGDLVISFASFGQKNDGTFESDSSFEIDLGACGTFKTDKIHTSCSRPVILDFPNPMGSASLTFTDGCGACLVESPVATFEESWSGLKGRFSN